MAQAQPEVIHGLDNTEVVNGVKWVKGWGKLPCDVMLIGDRPGRAEVHSGNIFTGQAGDLLWRLLNELGFDQSQVYATNAVKYMPKNNRAVNAGDIKLCKPTLNVEIARCKPRVIVCLGANALKAVLGRSYKLTDYRSVVIDHPELPDVKVIATYNPAHILRNPDMMKAYRKDWEVIIRLQKGEMIEQEDVESYLITTVQQLRDFRDFLFKEFPNPDLVVDAEWNGATWMSPDRYIRLLQIGFRDGAAMVIEFFDEGVCPPNPEKPEELMPWIPEYKRQIMDDLDGAWAVVKEILEDTRVSLTGHNVISDGEWLLTYDVDIRPRVVNDTMLAEHDVNETGPFNLSDMTCVYTNMGRYDVKLVEWVNSHKAVCKHGYGPVPRELIVPYSGRDVEAPRQIAKQQEERLREFKEPRGKYPSLWQIDLETQRLIYELEISGLRVDKERLAQLEKTYTVKLQELESQLIVMASAAGMEKFNHRSVYNCRELLFDKLKLQPIETTTGKSWDWVMRQRPEQQETYQPSTKATTLEILEESHPAVKLLLYIRRLDMAVKTWLHRKPEADEATKGGGIGSKIWVDGRIHTHFSQLSDTARFTHSKPNSANWPKKAESYMEDIFGDKVPPGIRTIIVPDPGNVLMESDFAQAELFVLARLSRDTNMIEALSTPGKDMHDMTAISSFGLQVLGPDGLEVDENHLLALAANDMGAFKDYQKQLVYVDQKGKHMSRRAFKDGIRVSAKNLNFGIPYGRGALDIARQVKAETGSKESLESLAAEIQTMMDAWKGSTYVQAWAYMEQCADAVSNPGFLVTPWGRKRRFPKAKDNKQLAAMQRKAQNFPIQSTVADTCMIAMYLMDEYRKKHGLSFKLVNQIHDAIMVEVPEEEIDVTKQMFTDTMGSIDIPVPGAPLRLAIDIEVLDRWGVKRKTEE